ncbi:MAG: hypothetical protein WCJ66_03875 [Verrucomicrobiota bacterium]
MSPAQTTPKELSSKPVPLLFLWRAPSNSLFAALAPIVLASLAFAVLLGMVRIKVAAPQFKMASKASWMLLPVSANGVSWALRAKEGGPLLARYEPTEWQGYPPFAQEALLATRIPAHTYAPSLRSMPGVPLAQAQSLADRGEAVLPHRVPISAARQNLPAGRLSPTLYPLSALGTSSLPHDLPTFTGEIDAALSATDWRFLLRLHPDGGVAEAVSLTRATGTAAAPLENWLHGVVFDPKLAADGGWLAVGIRFTNQPVNGTDPH